MATKTIKALVNGVVQNIEVEEMTSPEQPLSVEERVDTLEDKHEVVFTDGNILVGNGTTELEEMTPEETLEHINGTSVVTMTTNEYEALGETNANTLYMLTDDDDRPDWNENDESNPSFIQNRPFWEYEEPITESREFSAQSSDGAELVDAEFARLLYDNWENAIFTIGDESTANVGGYVEINDCTNSSSYNDLALTVHTVTNDGSDYTTLHVHIGLDSGTIVWGDHGMGHMTNGTITIPTTTIQTVVHHLDPKYIKDMYYDNGTTVTEVIPETTIEGFAVIQDPIYAVENAISMTPVVGATYVVNWDGVEYSAECKSLGELVYVGNENYVNMTSGGDIPFAIIFADATFLATESTASSHTISVTKIKHDLKQLDMKYLPIMEEMFTTVIELDGVVNDSEYLFNAEKFVGTYKVTFDGVEKIVEFIDYGDYSLVETDLYAIETWESEETIIRFYFSDKNPHSVKIEKISQVIKEEHLPDSVNIQSDWNQNDSTAIDYVKNRPFYSDQVETIFIDETVNITGSYYSDNQFYYRFDESLGLVEGNVYNVTFLGETFEGLIYSSGLQFTLSNGATICVYDTYMYSWEGDGLSRPFDADIKIIGTAETVYTLDEKYIPNSIMRSANAIGRNGSGKKSEIFNDVNYNEASGDYSHAEGEFVIASGNYSHAEGNNTEASGDYSHVEGWSTIAFSQYQHVQGKYNIEDTENKYAHIVGNGTSGTARSNAHTLDWSGNAEYAGDVKANACGGENPVSLVEVAEKVNNVKEVFMITATLNGSTYTLDKTYTDITTAIESGHLPVVYMSDQSMIINYMGCQSGFHMFATAIHGAGQLAVNHMLIISDHDVVRYRTEQFSTLPLATSANNGQILSVVNGVPTWIDMPTATDDEVTTMLTELGLSE